MRKIALFVMTCTLVLICSVVLAEKPAFEAIAVKDDFHMIAEPIISKDMDEVLLFGTVGDPMSSTAAAYCITPSGEQKWKLFELNPEAGMCSFTSVVLTEDGNYTALLKMGGTVSQTYICTIRDGKMQSRLECDSNVQNVYFAKNGILLVEGVKENGLQTSSKLIKADILGNVFWKMTYDKQLRLNNIVSTQGGYIGYGLTNEHYVERTSGLVFMFNERGEILWEHSRAGTEFTDGVCLSDGSVVLVGNVLALSSEEQWQHSIIAMYNEDGLVWEKDYFYGQQREGTMKSIINLKDGFLVACSDLKQRNEVHLINIDSTGTIRSEWDEGTSTLYSAINYSLLTASDGIYLLANGLAHDRSTSIEVMTIIKKVFWGT